MTRQGTSIRDMNSANMTRKEQQDFMHAKVAEFEDAMCEIEEHLNGICLVSRFKEFVFITFLLFRI